MALSLVAMDLNIPSLSTSLPNKHFCKVPANFAHEPWSLMVVIEVITKKVINTLMICKVTNKTYINYNVTLTRWKVINKICKVIKVDKMSSFIIMTIKR